MQWPLGLAAVLAKPRPALQDSLLTILGQKTANRYHTCMASLLEVSNLRKCYGDFEALAGVTFSVEPGELFGLLGPNGAGKTTLLSIVASLLDPSSGEAKLFQTPIRATISHSDKASASALRIWPSMPN